MNRFLPWVLALAVLTFALEVRLLAQDDAPTSVESRELPTTTRVPRGFLQIVFSGGPLGIANIVVLIGLSIVAVAVVVDNLRIIQRSRLMPPGLADEVRTCMANGDRQGAADRCAEQPSLLAAVISRGLAETGGWAEIDKAMEEALAEQAARLFRRIEYLSMIGNLAPLVGLLGTVTGMLLAFKQVADTEGNAGAAQLAPGIYQALVTTVFGLVIAIPSLAAFALLRSRVDELVAEAANAATHALAPLKQVGTASQPSVVTPPPLPPR